MNSKTAKLINRAARVAALVTVTKDGRYHPNKHAGDYMKVIRAVHTGFLRNMKRRWRLTPWNQRSKLRRGFRHMILQGEHALAKGRAV